MPFTREINSRASADRLELLIEERLAHGADKEEVDRRIWNLFGEKWAILYTDLSGFSRNVANFGIVHFLQTIYESHRLLVPVIQKHNGILLKTEGDSLMIIHRSVDDAIQAAVAMQHATQSYNTAQTAEEKVLLCVGIGYGDMLRIGDQDVFGAEVNAACKLGEDIAKANEILITGAVMRAAKLPQGTRVEPFDSVPAGADSAYRLMYQ